MTQTTTPVDRSARLRGHRACSAVTRPSSAAVLRDDLADPAGTRLWRTVRTDTDERAGPSQVVRYYRVRGSVELAGELDGATSTVYRPALVELPARVRPGTESSWEGSLGADLRYRSHFRASAGAGDAWTSRASSTTRPGRGNAAGTSR